MKKIISRREFIKAGLVAAGGTAAAWLSAINPPSNTSAAPQSGTPYFFPMVYRVAPTATPTRTPIPTPTSPPAGVYTFTDGTGGNVNTAQDMQMSLGWPTWNGGAHPEFQFERNQRCMLRFNLSSIPRGARCNKATLYLYHNYAPESNDPIATITVYSVAAANARWNAGNKDIDPASAGESCWNALASDGRGGVATPWAGSAGCSTAGVDYESRAIASFTFDPTRPYGWEYPVSLDAARVQGWFGTSNTNYGIILFSHDHNTGHVAQADNRDTRVRPKLVVEYEIT